MSKLSKYFLLSFLTLCLCVKTYGADISQFGIHEAFVIPTDQMTPNIPLQDAPPETFNEQIPEQPSNDTTWIPGYWDWDDQENDYIWICGVWRRPPPDHTWIQGRWFHNGQGWVWEYGFWSPVSSQNLLYINKTPPQVINEQVPNSPGNNFFWAPGYWEYLEDSKNYSWLSGSWVPFDQNWILTPASYIWRQNGYVFVPMYWDFPLDDRGYAYACSENEDEEPVVMAPERIIQELYYYYPDYVPIYWHWWNYHPGWWNDCLCAPSWWNWSDWWTIPGNDLWGLWWWWGHPGSYPPLWLSSELAQQIAPPPITIINNFKNINQPIFDFKRGEQRLLPKGSPGVRNIPKPKITRPSEVAPGRGVMTPRVPQGRGLDRRPDRVTPPSRDFERTPSYPLTPRPSYPPGQQNRPFKSPSDRQRPPTITPPSPPSSQQQPSFIPPRRGQQEPSFMPPGHQRPSTITPPSRQQPQIITPPNRQQFPSQQQQPSFTPPGRQQQPSVSPPGRQQQPSFTPPGRQQQPSVSPPPARQIQPSQMNQQSAPKGGQPSAPQQRGQGKGKDKD